MNEITITIHNEEELMQTSLRIMKETESYFILDVDSDDEELKALVMILTIHGRVSAARKW